MTKGRKMTKIVEDEGEDFFKAVNFYFLWLARRLTIHFHDKRSRLWNHSGDVVSLANHIHIARIYWTQIHFVHLSTKLHLFAAYITLTCNTIYIDFIPLNCVNSLYNLKVSGPFGFTSMNRSVFTLYLPYLHNPTALAASSSASSSRFRLIVSFLIWLHIVFPILFHGNVIPAVLSNIRICQE